MRYVIIAALALFVACAPAKPTSRNTALYEILTQQETGGGHIEFYEIISEEKEIPMLLNDEFLKDKISRADIKTANFIVLNMGEKRTGGYAITVDGVRETDTQIILKTRHIKPEPGTMVTQAITYPYTIVKINSKKPIVIE